MWINKYPEMIAESYEELLKGEKRLRGSPLESRIKMLRPLKGGAYRSQSSNSARCSAIAAASWDAGGRLTDERWPRDALLVYHRPNGRSERITEEALDALEKEMKQGNITASSGRLASSWPGASAYTTKA
jgi:hypothetical protein